MLQLDVAVDETLFVEVLCGQEQFLGDLSEHSFGQEEDAVVLHESDEVGFGIAFCGGAECSDIS